MFIYVNADPQTLVEICRTMGIWDVFMLCVPGKIYLRFGELPELMLTYCRLDTRQYFQVKFGSKWYLKGNMQMLPWEKKCHGELTVTTVVTAPGPMITAQSRLGEVTAQSWRGHSSVTARSQLSHGEVTAQSRHLQYDHGSVTARSQLNHGPGHGSVTADCDHFGHRELTVSSLWAHGEQSWWPIFFSWELSSPSSPQSHEQTISEKYMVCNQTIGLGYQL